MSSFLDRGQLVGYRFEEKELVVVLSDRMAQKMLADGWDVHYEEEIGSFIKFALEEESSESTT